MTTAFTGFTVEQDADGRATPGHLVTQPTLYLDTSDLSYLLLGRLGRDHVRPRQWRARLVELLARDRVRLRLSLVHFGELVFRAELARSGLRDLEEIPNVYITTTSPVDIFASELTQRQVTIVDRPAAQVLAELRGFRFPFPGFRRGVSPRLFAGFVRFAMNLGVSAENSGKKQRLRESAEKRRQWKRVLSGDLRDLPRWRRPLARVGLSVGRRMALAFGLPPDVVARLQRAEPHGLRWAVTAADEPTFPRRDGKRWNAEDARSMPATVLRSSVERACSDPRRPARVSTVLDAEHLAYVGYSDYSTIDGANFDATKAVRPLLSHLHIFRAGNLDPLLDALEAHTEAATT